MDFIKLSSSFWWILNMWLPLGRRNCKFPLKIIFAPNANSERPMALNVKRSQRITAPERRKSQWWYKLLGFSPSIRRDAVAYPLAPAGARRRTETYSVSLVAKELQVEQRGSRSFCFTPPNSFTSTAPSSFCATHRWFPIYPKLMSFLFFPWNMYIYVNVRVYLWIAFLKGLFPLDIQMPGFSDAAA